MNFGMQVGFHEKPTRAKFQPVQTDDGDFTVATNREILQK